MQTPPELSDRSKAEMETQGTKDDWGKVRLDLFPTEALWGTCMVFTYGAQKYADYNWKKGMEWHRLYGALLRHLTAWWGGEEYDSESGLHHLDHAGCCMAMLQTHEKLGLGKDDRPPSSILKYKKPDTNTPKGEHYGLWPYPYQEPKA